MNDRPNCWSAGAGAVVLPRAPGWAASSLGPDLKIGQPAAGVGRHRGARHGRGTGPVGGGRSVDERVHAGDHIAATYARRAIGAPETAVADHTPASRRWVRRGPSERQLEHWREQGIVHAERLARHGEAVQGGLPLADLLEADGGDVHRSRRSLPPGAAATTLGSATGSPVGAQVVVVEVRWAVEPGVPEVEVHSRRGNPARRSRPADRSTQKS